MSRTRTRGMRYSRVIKRERVPHTINPWHRFTLDCGHMREVRDDIARTKMRCLTCEHEDRRKAEQG